MKTSRPVLLLLPAVLALALVLAGCGGGGGAGVPPDAIAVVGSTTISTAQFNFLMETAKGEDKAHSQPFPKVGTSDYTQLRDRAVAYLVQSAELTQEGQKLGVTVTQKDVDANVAKLRKQYYKGSQKKLLAALKTSGVTLPQYERLQQVTLLAQKVNAKVTSSVVVTKADAKKYYEENKTTTFTTQKSRSVRHILVTTKALAEKLEQKLAHGADFAALAKKYSKDTGSAAQGGKLTAVEGQLVKPFEKVAFSLKTHEISAPVHTVYGWHIIQALGPVEPAHVTPFSKVATEIRSNLLEQDRNSAWNAWLAKMAKDYDGKVSYATGYAPPATTSSTGGSTTATTTG